MDADRRRARLGEAFPQHVGRRVLRGAFPVARGAFVRRRAERAAFRRDFRRGDAAVRDFPGGDGRLLRRRGRGNDLRRARRADDRRDERQTVQGRSDQGLFPGAENFGRARRGGLGAFDSFGQIPRVFSVGARRADGDSSDRLQGRAAGLHGGRDDFGERSRPQQGLDRNSEHGRGRGGFRRFADDGEGAQLGQHDRQRSRLRADFHRVQELARHGDFRRAAHQARDPHRHADRAFRVGRRNRALAENRAAQAVFDAEG